MQKIDPFDANPISLVQKFILTLVLTSSNLQITAQKLSFVYYYRNFQLAQTVLQKTKMFNFINHSLCMRSIRVNSLVARSSLSLSAYLIQS